MDFSTTGYAGFIKPEELGYHYTSHEAALSIVRNRELWLTNIQYMNDREEGEGFKAYVDEYLRHRNDSGQPVEAAIYQLLQTIVKGQVILPIWAICFSARSDDAAQWDRYASNGKGVVLEVHMPSVLDVIQRGLPKELIGGYAMKGPVIYSKTEATRIVSETIELMEQRVKSGESANPNQDIVQLAALIKNPSFESENEFRIVLANVFYGAYKFIPRIDTIVPYLAVRLDRPAVLNICLGPNAAKGSETAWNMLLTHLGGPRHPQLSHSQSTLRVK
jgi:hypothetical protein